MAELTNTFFKLNDSDVFRKTSQVKQVVDILQVDIAGLNDDQPRSSSNDTKTRKKYEVFVSGGVAENTTPVTSSLFQTVFDQDYTTQTANELLDITMGCYHSSSLVSNTSSGTDASGKKLFPDTVLMMREKINIYKQYAQTLLGDSEKFFTAPYEQDFTHESSGSLTYRERIDEAIFINIKRLFARDGVVKEQFTLKINESASSDATNIGVDGTGTITITDSGASNSLRVTTHAGSVGTLKRSTFASGEDENVGLIFYEKGIVVLDAKRIFNTAQTITGNIADVSSNGVLSFSSSLIPDLWASGSIDDVLDHICDTRFGRSTASAAAFLNQTYINSSIYVCRVAPSEANYSRNPTYTDASGSIRVISEQGDDPFAYVTTIGLYDIDNNLLAVAKTSRPIEKNPEVDLSISVRIDY